MDNNLMELTKSLGKCQAACNYCFGACLREEDIMMMRECIKLDKECAEICAVTLALVASKSDFSKAMLRLCAAVCEKCAEECEKHPMDHCQDCAKACHECAEACQSHL